MTTRPDQSRKHEISKEAIQEWVAAAANAGRHRVFYDAHKDAPRGFGVRVTKGGAVSFVLNYYTHAAERRITVGRFPALSIAAARKKATVMRDHINAGGDPLGEKRAVRMASVAAKEEAKRKEAFGLGALLEAYVDYLKADGRASWREVAAMVKRHVTENESYSKMAARPADEITVDDVMPVFHDLAKAGRYTQARKLRAAMRAAYTAARKARTDASMHAFAGFQIRVNPLVDLDVTVPKESAEKAAEEAKERKWALTEDQLAAYWRRIHADTSARGALMRFHLLTGGQRVDQLARLTVRDYDASIKTITIRDTKGRRRVAYEHVVPLIPDAEAALKAMRSSDPRGDAIFTVTQGAEGAVYHTLWESMQDVAKAMVEAKEVHRTFTPGTIRKTVETRLQALGVSGDVRAHLLSHGRGGVQARHYEAHDYDKEKRDALGKLRRLCEPKGAAGNVSRIHPRRKA